MAQRLFVLGRQERVLCKEARQGRKDGDYKKNQLGKKTRRGKQNGGKIEGERKANAISKCLSAYGNFYSVTSPASPRAFSRSQLGDSKRGYSFPERPTRRTQMGRSLPTQQGVDKGLVGMLVEPPGDAGAHLDGPVTLLGNIFIEGKKSNHFFVIFLKIRRGFIFPRFPLVL